MTELARRGARERRLAAPPSLRELALEEIRLAITTGQLDEGRTYSAAGLAKELGMSLSPVREAMMSLVAEGTVEAVPNRGFRLRSVGIVDLEEIIRIRVALSMPAVEDLTRRSRDPEDHEVAARLDELDRLARAATAAIVVGEPEEFLRLDREFHRLLVESGLGRRAAEISLRLRDQSRLGGPGQPILPADRQAADDLVRIVALLRAGRTDDAKEAVTADLFTYRRILDQQGRGEVDEPPSEADHRPR